MLLFALINMKMTTVVNLCISAGLIACTIFASILIEEFLHPQKDVNKPMLSEKLFEEEMLQINLGKKVEPSYPDIPVMVWWTPFSGDDGIQECGKHKCFVTNDRDYIRHPNLKNVFFYATSVSEYDFPLPRPRDVEWSVLHEESPKNSQLFSHGDMLELFNHTSTFRQRSDLPLSTQYLESVEDITSTNFFKSTETKNRYIREEGYAPVVYVQSGCDCPSKRDLWVQEFMKYVPVDSYGTCLNNKELPLDLVGSEQMNNAGLSEIMSRYKFVLSMENAICQDYVTEKYWRSIEIGSVPIYLGAPNIEEFLPNNKSAITIKDYESIEDVANTVLKLDKDDEAYEEYLDHKLKKSFSNSWLKEQVKERRWGVSSDDQMELGNSVKHFQCLVCQRVSDNIKYTKSGFKPAVYKADESHYGCPVPRNPLTKKIDYNDWYFQDWLRMKHTARHLNSLVKEGSDFDLESFKQQVQQDWTQHFMDFVQGRESL